MRGSMMAHSGELWQQRDRSRLGRFSRAAAANADGAIKAGQQ